MLLEHHRSSLHF